MILRFFGWLGCKIGAHRWVDATGRDFWWMAPPMNHEHRAVCFRPGCETLHLSTEDRIKVVERKFRIITGGAQPSGLVSLVPELKVLPAPDAEEA